MKKVQRVDLTLYTFYVSQTERGPLWQSKYTHTYKTTSYINTFGYKKEIQKKCLPSNKLTAYSSWAFFVGRSVGRLVIWLASKAFVVVWYVLKLIQKLKYQIKYKWIRYCFHIICSCFGAVLLLGMSIEKSWDFSSTTTRIKSTNRQVVPPKNRVEGYRKHKITKYNAGCKMVFQSEYYGTSVESQRFAILIRKVVGTRWGQLITQ